MPADHAKLSTSGDDAPQETPLTKLSVEELRARYVAVIGRETSSSNRKLPRVETARGRQGPHPHRSP